MRNSEENRLTAQYSLVRRHVGGDIEGYVGQVGWQIKGSGAKTGLGVALTY
jgi:hypothetical protein